MANRPYQHIPVMAEEVINYLNPSAGKTLVDCTLGGGGHAQALLGKSKIQNGSTSSPYLPSREQSRDPKLKIIGFDQDEDAITTAKARLAQFQGIEYINDNFSNLKQHIKHKVDGFLFDLGVSSYQIDHAERGFSLQKDGPLDMRMDRREKLTAAEIVNNYPIEKLTKIFWEYGEERFAKRISNAISVTRNLKKIATTFELKAVIEKAIPTWKKRESVTRVFQALRIAVNSELENLNQALRGAIDFLKPGGRIVVLSYHSLEDRIVKRTFRAAAQAGILSILTKKPILPQEAEIKENPRARSAKLRAAEKI